MLEPMAPAPMMTMSAVRGSMAFQYTDVTGAGRVLLSRPPSRPLSARGTATMRILGIDHIGIASGDLGKHVAIFGGKLGLEIHDVEEKDPYGGLRSAFARVGDTDTELLEDRVPDGDEKVIDQRDIAKFVARRGQGLHHLALRVADVEEAIRDAKAAGLSVIDETPRPGARGWKIAFLHPRRTGGILMHFV